MTEAPASADYYAILQVHPDAEPEVIEAAYRGLMKKYHPDVAGDDVLTGADGHRRASAINEAYHTLRDPQSRRRYDAGRVRTGWTSGSARAGSRPGAPGWSRSPTRGGHPGPTPASAWGRVPARQSTDDMPEVSAETNARGHPLGWLAAAYYLLPGPYEWDRDRRLDAIVAILIPVIGVAGFALATGRLTPVIGDSLTSGVLAWATLLVLSVPLWPALPRILVAVLPSLVMLNADMNALLRQLGIPGWSVWGVLILVSLLLSARLYVFSVLPTLAVCWLLTLF